MKFGITGNSAKENFESVVTILLDKLTRSGLTYLVEDTIAAFLENRQIGFKCKPENIGTRDGVLSGSDIVIALGGDGTILRYARAAAFHDVPILGVNLGKLGFLAEVSTGELVDCIDELVKGDYNISERIIVEGEVSDDTVGTVYGLNDIVIDRGGKARVIDIDVDIENDFVITFKGDGLIVCTPTGSTAYSLSCGGPIVAPDTNVLVITPISPHTLNARPIIVPGGKVIHVTVRSQDQKIPLTTDGQMVKEYSSPMEITFRKSRYRTRLIKRKVRSYYDVLREKLMWGRDIRSK
jgi:NAD+ kinase